MLRFIKCLFRHSYEVYGEEPLYLVGTDKVIGKIMILRCSECGKIKLVTIKTTDDRLY